LVLNGGRARRMSGDDKTRIRVGGLSILERTLERLRPQCTALIINANDPERFATTGLPVVVDTVVDFAGPLAGILAGLDWTAKNAPDIAWLLSVSGDSPFLPRDLVARLHQARIKAGATIACARSDARVHPTVALWPIALREDLRRALNEGVRRVREFSERYPLAAADWPAAPVDPFFNVNTPEDVTEAERLAARFPLA
jgi:molybdopterin-guanine dinucleotide biosynthesis protein A